MRVVIDTNVLISATLWRGAPYRALLAIHAGLADLVLSPPIFAELNRVLIEKFQFSPAEATEVVEVFKGASLVVEIPGTVRVVSDDPEDDKFLETAKVGGAPWIVSGDMHLLKLGTWQAVEIMTARTFLARIVIPPQ